MTNILIAGPLDKETEDDHFTRIIHQVYRGQEGAEKNSAKLELILEAMRQLCGIDGKSEKDCRLNSKLWNFPESVQKDLELHNYGLHPFPVNVFSVADHFAVLGRLGNSYSGFALDFFLKEIGNTKTFAFSQSKLEESLWKAGGEIFGFKSSSGGIAYTERSLRRGKVDLTPYKQNRTVEAVIYEGELVFGGNGKYQNNIIKEFMDLAGNYKVHKIKNHFEKELNSILEARANNCARNLKVEYEKRGYRFI